MSDQPQVPPHVQQFGRLLRTGLQHSPGSGRGAPSPRFCGDTFVAQASNYLRLLSGFVGSLAPTFEALMTDIVNNPAVSECVLRRRTQAFLNDLSDWHLAMAEIQNLDVNAADQTGLALLIAVYRHHLGAVDEWLRRLVQSIENPRVMLQQQGTQLNAKSDVPLKLELCLNLTQAPELPQLERWLLQRQDKLNTAVTQKLNRNVGTLAFLLGLFWLN